MAQDKPTLLKHHVLPPRQSPARSMVILLHGYGADGADLLSLGKEWQTHYAFDHTVFVSPDAPEPCELSPSGRQWFSLRAAEGIPSGAFTKGDMAKTPAACLNTFIDAELAQWGLQDSQLAVVGFSQGAMMATYTMPRRKQPCAGIVAYSGLLIAGDGLKDKGIVKMPVLAIHGGADQVVPPSMLKDVEAGFRAANFDVTVRLHPRLGHSIDAAGLETAATFLQKVLTA